MIAYVIDWFHIAMKIQPMQQIADHIVRCRDEWTNETVVLDEEIRDLKWKLWHGQVDRAMQQLEELIADMAMLRGQGDLSAGRIWQLGQALLTYIRQNKAAIVDYGARYRSGRRITSSLAESAVDTLVAPRMVKKQQMQWSLKGAHRMSQSSRGRAQRRLDQTFGLATTRADASASLRLDVRAHPAIA